MVEKYGWNKNQFTSIFTLQLGPELDSKVKNIITMNALFLIN